MTGKRIPPIEASIASDHPLFEVIEGAYQAFSVAKPASTEVCVHCCMDAAIERDFYTPPIRDLPLAYVHDWFFAAADPSGISKQTWAYLLPRILEIIAAGESASTGGLEPSLCRFETGNPSNWSEEEWRVLDLFQRRYLQLQIEDGTHALDDVLCMFRLGGWQLEDLLDQVRSMPTGTLARKLWRDWCKDHKPGSGKIWITASWEGTDNSTAFDFYTSSELHRRLIDVASGSESDPQLIAVTSAVTAVIEADSLVGYGQVNDFDPDRPSGESNDLLR